MKLNLTFVKRTERTSKNTGKPFTSVSIKATQYGDRFISGFGNKDNANWKVGDEVEVADVTTKGEYLNFEMPKNKPAPAQVETMALSHKIDQVSSQLLRIINHLSGQNRLDQTSDGKPLPNFDVRKPVEDDGFDQINPEEIPF